MAFRRYFGVGCWVQSLGLEPSGFEIVFPGCEARMKGLIGASEAVGSTPGLGVYTA